MKLDNVNNRFAYAGKAFLLCCMAVFAVSLVAATVCSADNSGESNDKRSSVDVEQNDKTLLVSVDGRPALEYLFGGVEFKPCVSRWHTPEGINILRNSPHDHLHHHAMMFAVAVDGVNFWEEHPKEKAGREVGQAPQGVFSKAVDGNATAGFSQLLDWTGPDGKVLLEERRAIELTIEKDVNVSLLSWTSTLSTPPGKQSAELGGNYYFGFGLRFVESMDKSGKIIVADGIKSRSVLGGRNWIAPAKWVAYTAAVDGHAVTVAIFDHPQNPRFPAGIFHMSEPFAYLSATIGLADRPYQILAGKPLQLKYGAALWDSEKTTDEIEAAYQKWLEGKNGN